jgi:hypothetical protein
MYLKEKQIAVRFTRIEIFFLAELRKEKLMLLENPTTIRF